jgi:hypothetical protein
MGITSVTSETLQAKLRELLPSQRGFGTDISASDTIVPIIDLTASAEGSDVREDLQKALAFGSQSAFNVRNTTTTLISTTGFYRVFGNAVTDINAATSTVSLILTDGVTDKTIWSLEAAVTGGTDNHMNANLDFIVFIAAGESFKATASDAGCAVGGSTRQIADINGTLVQPSGFIPS